MQMLRVLGWLAVAVIAGMIFVVALGWDAGAIRQPLAATSITSMLAASGVWWVRVVSLAWVLAGVLCVFLSLTSTTTEESPENRTNDWEQQKARLLDLGK
jgi:hypothetical protein